MFKKDSISLGLLLGFLAPIAGMFIYYFIQFRSFPLEEFFSILLREKSLLTGVISISLIANAIVFTIFINRHHDKTARGVFIATCIYAIAALLWKILR